jgi:hypothetical protein
MVAHWRGMLGLILLLPAAGSAIGQEPQHDAKGHDAKALAHKVDQLLAERWTRAGIEPVPQADDAEFLRRIYLDLAGRIPSVAEAREFLADTRADRREKLVDKLLASPRYAMHFTNVWRAILIPEANNNFIVRTQQGGFETWLRQRVARNAGYDEMARDLLTAPIGAQGFGALALAGTGQASPLAFYSAKEFKPENLAAGTARVFLGVSVECAQCHNHPFAEWKREQFWGFAAFFAGIQSQRVMDFLLPGKEMPDKRELAIPGMDKVVQAVFLDGTEPAWKPKTATRATLAEWVTSPDNAYFCRTAVNRTWAYFFGTGLVEALDEMAATAGAARNVELLDLLAQEFAAHRFDMHFLIRTITSTRAYQLTSGATADKARDEPSLFARMPLRGLTGEQLFDSVAMATGLRDIGAGRNDLLSAATGGNRSPRAEFLSRFATQTEQTTKAQSSILQALSLMNGKLIAGATSLEQSEMLAAVVDAPFLTTPQRIETLYLATLSRKPATKELERARRFIDDAVKNAPATLDEEARRQVYGHAMADVFWALLNSAEFSINH